jgi:formate dehydrogenase subunit beta
MTDIPQKGAILKGTGSVPEQIKAFLQQAADKKIFDAVMLPMQVPSQDSYAWIMIKDINLLADASAIAPIMPVNAAKAIKRFTRKGEGELKTAVLIRPCEVRACVELVKLNQINLDKLLIMSYDCPGAIPMQDYIANPKALEKEFDRIIESEDFMAEITKPVCHFCEDFSYTASDLHFGWADKKIIAIAGSDKGNELLTAMDMKHDLDLSAWQKKIDEIKKQRQKNKETRFDEMKTQVEGFEALLDTFSECIGCHNCQSACPICYCRQCYFDSAASQPNSDLIMLRANERGGLTFPLDRLMFHTGRMSHMSLSCVSCGLCSDACPVNIPVAEIFSYVGSQTQAAFEYKAGASLGEGLPLKEYKPEELGELQKLISSVESGENDNE